MSEFRKEIEKYAKYVIKQSRTNLTKKKHNNTKELFNSLSYKVRQNRGNSGRFESGYEVSFDLGDYGDYQDQGVHGTNSSYIENKGSKFKYKSSSNLIGLEAATGTFAAFAKRKRLKFRNLKSGKFITYVQMGFVLAQSIKKKGIKASKFFSKPFDQADLKFGDKIAVAYGEDIIKKLIEK